MKFNASLVKNYLMSILLLLGSVSCDSVDLVDSNSSETSSAKPDEEWENEESVSEETLSRQVDIEKSYKSSSQLRFLTVKGLDQVYGRVFDEPNNANNCPFYNRSDCQVSFFSDEEAASLGSMELTREVKHFSDVTSINLNYLKALRTMLHRECSQLVEAELSSITPDNLLARHGNPPTNKDMERFLNKLLGIGDLDIETGIDLEPYSVAAQQSYQAAIQSKSRENVIEDIYVATCVALSMDPAVIAY